VEEAEANEQPKSIINALRAAGPTWVFEEINVGVGTHGSVVKRDCYIKLKKLDVQEVKKDTLFADHVTQVYDSEAYDQVMLSSCVCMYVCVCVCECMRATESMCMCLCVRTNEGVCSVCARMCVYACVCMCVHVCACVCMCVHECVCVCVFVCACVTVNMFVFVCLCACDCTCTHVRVCAWVFSSFCLSLSLSFTNSFFQNPSCRLFPFFLARSVFT